MRRCPKCGSETMGALAYGLPGWICMGHELPLAGGPGPDFAAAFGLVGSLMVYEPGFYWSALWDWLRGGATGG